MNRKFTDEEIDVAHRTNLVRFLESHGETVRTISGHNYWTYECETICITGNLWYNFYTQKGGEAIGFVMLFFNKTYSEAIAMLLNLNEANSLACEAVPEIKNVFKLPEGNETNNRAVTYLTKTRGIDNKVVNAFIDKGLIYEQARYHNVVFLGKDKHGISRHAHLRGTGVNSTFKMTATGSSNEYSFHWNGIDDEIYLFEAPIDMLSYISLHQIDWQSHSYAAACSVSDRVLMQCLKDTPGITNIHICFDNDEAGLRAASRIYSKLINEGYVADIFVSFLKDWNEDLLASKKVSQ